MSSPLIAAKVVNDVSDAATNGDSIAVEDTMDVTASVVAVAFLVVEFFLTLIIEKWKN